MSKDSVHTEGPQKVRSNSTDQQDNLRKSLKTVQRVATDKENLTGRPPKSTGKDAIKEVKIEIKDKVEVKKKKLVNKEKSIQTESDNKITAEDLTSDAGPSENFWQVLAEKRRIALEDILKENKELHEKIEALQEENRICKEMLKETKNVVEVLTEMIGEQEESGIDMAEASTLSLPEHSSTFNSSENCSDTTTDQ